VLVSHHGWRRGQVVDAPVDHFGFGNGYLEPALGLDSVLPQPPPEPIPTPDPEPDPPAAARPRRRAKKTTITVADETSPAGVGADAGDRPGHDPDHG
jgi:hypothetical protein